MSPSQDILVAVVGRPHGVRGLVRLVSYASSPDALAAMALRDDRGRSWRVEWRGDGIAALFDAAGQPLTDRTAAERVVNLRLHVDRADLPPPDEDEFYLADLVGLAAIDGTGSPLGSVRAVHDYGAGPSLEIAPSDGATFLVPFTRAVVPTVDVAGGRVVLMPPAEVEARTP